MLSHYQNVFLAHYLGTTALLWFYLNNYANSKKKARQRVTAKRAT